MGKQKIKIEYTSETIAERTYGDGDDCDTVFIEVQSAFGKPVKLCIGYNRCSKDLEEYYGDCDLEDYIHVEGDDLRKLASKFSALNTKTLVERIVIRFEPYGLGAYKAFEEFLKKKGIHYSTSFY
ncbi:MAG: hypothetical protein LKF31_03010 [Muribaculaceae bacterium]|jgi:hypothetical protein|nr:hypothetical protein [Muribaculaceae bacterium]